MTTPRPRFPGFRPLKANFTATPNQFFDHVVGHHKPCVERVVAILIRSTLGWEDPDTGERRLEVELALDDFVRPQLSRYSAREGLAGAIEAGFVVETLPATNRAAARYALRWDDADAQMAAIARQRQSRGTLDRPGVPAAPPRWRRSPDTPDVDENAGVTRGTEIRRQEIRRQESGPPVESDSEKKGEKEKKIRGETFNVGGRSDFISAEKAQPRSGPTEATPPPRPAGAADWLDRQAMALVAELQDKGSERRHRQLLSVCEQHGLSDLPRQALQATRERLVKEGRRGVVEKPGAYYCRVLTKLLADRQVFVPTTAEVTEEDPEAVRLLARASLGLA